MAGIKITGGWMSNAEKPKVLVLNLGRVDQGWFGRRRPVGRGSERAR
jgi:hypothetical protein